MHFVPFKHETSKGMEFPLRSRECFKKTNKQQQQNKHVNKDKQTNKHYKAATTTPKLSLKGGLKMMLVAW